MYHSYVMGIDDSILSLEYDTVFKKLSKKMQEEIKLNL